MAGPGGGKTWALNRAAELASARGVTVIEAGPSATHQLTLTSLSADRSRRGGAAHFEQIVEQALESAGGDTALLLVDDVHLADRDDVYAIAALSSVARPVPIRVIAAFRASPREAARTWAEMARRNRSMATIELAPFDLAATQGVLADELGELPEPAIVAHVLALCAGNPLLTVNAARAIARATSLPVSAEELVHEVSRTIGNTPELLGIDGDQRVLVEAASVLGPRFRFGVATEVAALNAGGHEAVDALWRLGLVTQGPGRAVEFAQPIVQLTTYAQLTPPWRSCLHGRAFTALVRQGFERRAAEHAALADLAGDENAITVLSRVGRSELRAGAAERAAKRFRDAIDLASDRATPAMHLALAEALLCGGQPRLAARAVERMLSEFELNAHTRVTPLRVLATSLEGSGERRAALLQLQIAAEVAHTTAKDLEPAIALDIALLSLRLGDVAYAEELLSRPRSETPLIVASQQALVRCILRAFRGDTEAVLDVDRTALELVQRSLAVPSSHHSLVDLALLCGLVLGSNGPPGAAEAFMTAAATALCRHVAPWSLAGLMAAQAHVLVSGGHLEAADTTSADAVASAADAPANLPLALASRANVLFHQGRVDACAELCDAADRALRSSGDVDVLASAWLASIRGGIALNAGQLGEAAVLFGELSAMISSTQMPLLGGGGWQILGVTSLVRGGSAEATDEFVSHLGSGVAAAVSWALLAERDGRVAEARDLLEDAAAQAEKRPDVLDRLAIAWLRGGLLRRSGHDVESRRLCLPALRKAQSIGAVTLGLLLESELTVAVQARGRRRRPPGELTAAERRVVEQAALGRSNREIAGQLWISINTVQTHLRRAYAKLGVTSRADLSRATAPADHAAIA